VGSPCPPVWEGRQSPEQSGETPSDTSLLLHRYIDARRLFRALRTATKLLTGPDETHNRGLFIPDFQKVLLTLIEFHLSLSGLNGPCGLLAEGFRVLTRGDELIDTHI